MKHSTNRYLATQLNKILDDNQTQFRGVSLGGVEGNTVTIQLKDSNTSIVAVALNNHTPGNALVYKEPSGVYYAIGESLANAPTRTTSITYRRTNLFIPTINEVVQYPFKIFSLFTVGGDNPEFNLPGYPNIKNIPITKYTSLGRGRDDYLVALNESTTLYALGVRNWEVDVTTNQSWKSFDYWVSPIQSRSNVGRYTVVNRYSDGNIAGTPVESRMRILATFHDSKFGWAESYPETYYFATGTDLVDSINYSKTWDFPFGSIPNEFDIQTEEATFNFSDNFIGSAVAPPEYGPAGCVEEDAGNNPQPSSLFGSVPGREVDHDFTYNLNMTRPVLVEYVENGIITSLPGTHSISIAGDRQLNISTQPRNYEVVVSCAGTGTISFVPRLFFDLVYEPSVVSVNSNETYEYNEHYSQEASILPGFNIQADVEYRENHGVDYTPFTFGVGVSTVFSLYKESYRRLIIPEGKIYSNKAESCIYQIRTVIDDDKLVMDGEISVESSNLTGEDSFDIPTVTYSDVYGYNENAARTDNIDATNGSRVILETDETIYKYKKGGTEIEFGRKLNGIGKRLSIDIENTNIGDVINIGLVNLTTGINRNRVSSIPAPSNTYIDSWTSISPESQVIGKKFIVVQDNRQSGRDFSVLECVGSSINSTGAISERTSRTETFTASIQVTAKYEKVKAPPFFVTFGTTMARYDDYQDMSSDLRYTTIKESSEAGVLWDLYYTVEPLDTEKEQKHYYSKGRFMANGKIEHTYKDIEGNILKFDADIKAIKVNP